MKSWCFFPSESLLRCNAIYEALWRIDCVNLGPLESTFFTLYWIDGCSWHAYAQRPLSIDLAFWNPSGPLMFNGYDFQQPDVYGRLPCDQLSAVNPLNRLILVFPVLAGKLTNVLIILLPRIPRLSALLKVKNVNPWILMDNSLCIRARASTFSVP